MIARLHRSMKDKDQGFTLIELLVVIVIIGILAAIAIPVFLNQRKKGVDAGLKSDLKNAASQVETYAIDHPTSAVATDQVTTGTPGTGALAELRVSPGNTITVVPHATINGAYCLFGWNAGASAARSATSQMRYLSESGGLQFSTVAATTCS